MRPSDPPSVKVDLSRWSGEGSFTQTLVDAIADIGEVAFARVEDAPAARSEVEYNFISNEIFVAFRTAARVERTRRFGFWPSTRVVLDPQMSLDGFEGALGALEGIGPPDYGDEGMLQYLRTERVIPPYQTRGYKLVELVRLYEVGTEPRR